MADGNRGLLTIGVFLVIVVVGIILYQPLQIIRDWMLVLPFIIALAGCWIIALAGMKASSPQKYEIGGFATLSWGLLLVAIGGAWFLYGFGWYYSIIVILLALAGLVIAVALKRK
jgi:cobalamin synthase